METSRDAQAQAGLTLYFLGKTHAGLRKLSAYYRQRGFRVSNVVEPPDLASAVGENAPDVILIDLQSRNDVSEFMDALAANTGSAGIPTVAIISSTTDEDTAEALYERCDDSVSWPLKATDLSVKLFNLIVAAGRALPIEVDPRDADGTLFRGQIVEHMLRPLLQLLYLSRRDGVITLESEGRRGNLWFKDGKLIDAQVGALDWEESLDLIRRFHTGSFAISFQAVARKRFIERGALQWLSERERAEADADAAQGDDDELGLSFLDHDEDDRDEVDTRGLVAALGSDEDSEAYEVTTSTSPFLQAVPLDDDRDEEEAEVRTLPALQAVRANASAHSVEEDDDYEDEDDDYEDDDDEDDDDEDDEDYEDESESTVARVSLRIGRVTREELERQMRLDALGIDDQPFTGTRISAVKPQQPPTPSRPAPFATEPATEEVLSIATEEAPESAFDEAEPYVAAGKSGSAPFATAQQSEEDEDHEEAVVAAAAAAVAAQGAATLLTEPVSTVQAPSATQPTSAPVGLAAANASAPAVTATKPAPTSPAVGAQQQSKQTKKQGKQGKQGKQTKQSPQPSQRPTAAAALPSRAESQLPRPVSAQPDEQEDRRRGWMIPVGVVLVLLLLFLFNPFGGGDSNDKVPPPVARLPVDDGKTGDKPVGTDGRTEVTVVQTADAGNTQIAEHTDASAGVKPQSDPSHAQTKQPAVVEPKPIPIPVASKPVETRTPPPEKVAVSPDKSDPVKTAVAPTPRPVQRPPATPKPAAVAAVKPPVKPDPQPPAATPPPVKVAPEPTPRPAKVASVDSEAVARALKDAAAKEQAGDLKRALILFAQAVDLDNSNAEAREGVDRVREKLSQPATKPGELFINSLPYGLVYIDGEKIGYTPVHKMDTVPRQYVIRITNPEYGACSTVREVRPGERTFVYLKLDDDEACGRTAGSP